MELTATRLIKSAARALPATSPVRRTLTVAYGDWKIRRARRALLRAGGEPPAVLSAEMLPTLMAEGFRPPDPVRYDPEGLIVRAKEKVDAMSRMAGLTNVHRALELGCWDGMVGRELAARGIAVVGLDVVLDGIDQRARLGGVQFVQSDAERIALADGSFDLVFSFASFEHFAHPDGAVEAIHRVLRPGGRAFINFGPLYFSPYGRHAYRQIPIPFCHLLFDETTLHDWSAAAGLPHAWPFVNGWSLEQYRSLWRASAERFRVVHYEEHSTGGVGVELVTRFPQCFRGRVTSMDELLVSHVDITLEKR